jgi:hypothetical protein
MRLKGAGADEVSERFGRIELFWEAMGMKANRANPTFGGLFYVFPQSGRDRIPIPFSQFEYRRNPNS